MSGADTSLTTIRDKTGEDTGYVWGPSQLQIRNCVPNLMIDFTSV